MRVIVAPNAFKRTLSPVDAAHAIARGLRRALPDVFCELAPLADGGDGFLEAMQLASGAQLHTVLVRGPLHAPVAARFGVVSRPGAETAIIESAQAAGLALVDRSRLDPLGASTGGVGELVREARHVGATSFLVGVGGTASIDGGTGLARALGYRFLDAAGDELPEGGGPLTRLDRIDASGFDSSWLLLPSKVAVDVDSALLGEGGAAAVFGPQKGADAGQVAILERGLSRLAEITQRDLGTGMANQPGAGAGGGLAFGLAAFLGAELAPGARSVLEAVDFDRRLEGADLMITGEGSLDAQSLRGKAPVEAGRAARRRNVRCVALVGRKGEGWEEAAAIFDEIIEVAPDLSAEGARARVGEMLEAAAATLLA